MCELHATNPALFSRAPAPVQRVVYDFLPLRLQEHAAALAAAGPAEVPEEEEGPLHESNEWNIEVVSGSDLDLGAGAGQPAAAAAEQPVAAAAAAQQQLPDGLQFSMPVSGWVYSWDLGFPCVGCSLACGAAARAPPYGVPQHACSQRKRTSPPPPRMVFMRAVHPQSQQFAVCRGKHPPAATLRCAVLPQAAEQLDEEVLKQEAVEETDAGVEDLMAQLAGLTS